MRPTIATWILALLLGLVAADDAAADRRRKEKRQAKQSSEVEQPQPESPAEAASEADLISSLGMFVYPAGGQTPEQQAADQAECTGWAQAQVGTAAEAPAATAPPPEEPAEESRRDRRKGRRTGGAVKGAAKGALIGEALEDDEPEVGDNLKKAGEDYKAPESRDEVGDNVKRALDDDEPSKAEVGAAVGAVAGRRKAKKGQEMAAQQAEQQAEAAKAQAAAAEVSAGNENLKKALAACLEGKGYKVG